MAQNSSLVSVAILGATGMVGQRFVQMLENHPQLKVVALGASLNSSGKKYKDVCLHWKMTTPIPSDVGELVIHECLPKNFPHAHIIFSGLDSSVAGEIEQQFCDAGFFVFSNAKNHRMNPKIPLVVPLVNLHHLSKLKALRSASPPTKSASIQRPPGFIVTNANCASTGVSVIMKILHDSFKLTQVHVVTMQAISGAGYPGVASMDITNNVIPYIDGEAEKLETEPLKILGDFNESKMEFTPATSILIDAMCNRVAVVDGHMASVSFRFETCPSVSDVIHALNAYTCEAQTMKLHSAPKQCVVVHSNPTRPQPRIDAMIGGGFTVSVGNILQGRHYWHCCMTILSHNTILGAAGSSILNAETALAMGLCDGVN